MVKSCDVFAYHDYPLSFSNLNWSYGKFLDKKDTLSHIKALYCVPNVYDTTCEINSLTNARPFDIEQWKASMKFTIGTDSVYLCGNSLGLQPSCVRPHLNQHLDVWSKKAVHAHFDHTKDTFVPAWSISDLSPLKKLSKIVGANPQEVAVMGSLTSNLHLLLSSFYRPDSFRYKIIMERNAFPSDLIAVQSQLMLHGMKPDALVLIDPDDSNGIFPMHNILSTIRRFADTCALILLPGVHYATGQVFDIQLITQFAHSFGIITGWDLAHAVGNIKLRIHEWRVDFAVWCSYKYLNAGPGTISSLFVHQSHFQINSLACGFSNLGSITRNSDSSNFWFKMPRRLMEKPFNLSHGTKFQYRSLPRLAGWWGLQPRYRFSEKFTPLFSSGAAGWKQSNPSILDITTLNATLGIFSQVQPGVMFAKRSSLTQYFLFLIENEFRKFFFVSDICCETPNRCSVTESSRLQISKLVYSVLTSTNPWERGSQISFKTSSYISPRNLVECLKMSGYTLDARSSNIVRLAFSPLYNCYEDVWRCCFVLQSLCEWELHNSYESFSEI